MDAELEVQYRLRHGAILEPLAKGLGSHIAELVETLPRIDRVQARPKSPERFMAKALKEEEGVRKYSDPLNEIQDQVGARIVTFYSDDVDAVCEKVERYFRHIEKKRVVPGSVAEFGYFGFHYIVRVPSDVLDSSWDERHVPTHFELQIKTLFQHAWSEANHDLGYKELNGDLTSEERRKMAWASAQAWGADQIFNDLFRSKRAD